MTQSVSCSVGLGVSLSANRSCHPFLFSHFGTFKALKTQKGKGIAEMGAAAISAATVVRLRFGCAFRSVYLNRMRDLRFRGEEKRREETCISHPRQHPRQFPIGDSAHDVRVPLPPSEAGRIPEVEIREQ